MDYPPNNNSPKLNRNTLRGLLVWLGLLPIIFGLLVLCGQLALLVSFKNTPTSTASRLIADYLPWPYDLIPGINIPALIEDIQNDERALNSPVSPIAIVTGVFLEPPTPVVENTLPVPATPTIPPAETATKPAQTPSPTIQASRTPTLRPTATRSPTATNTRTATFLPTWTPSEEPHVEPTSTNTPKPTATNTPVDTPTSKPTATHTATTKPKPPTKTPETPKPPTNTPVTPTPVTPTNTPITPTPVTPTNTPVTPEPTNTPDPTRLRPSVGMVQPGPETGTCQVSFGYNNENDSNIFYALDGPLNILNIDDPANIVSINPERPEVFLPGVHDPAFTVVWRSGPLFWRLGGFQTTEVVCNP